MNKELVQYIESNIYPLYSRNDWAHHLWHIEDVVQKSLKLARNYEVNLDMVYLIASFHDIGCFISRENHEEISAHLMEQDSFIQKLFSATDIKIMSEAIIDHRGSLEYEPRSIYGKIVSAADRFTTVEGIMKSTHCYTLEFFPEVSWEKMIEISYDYIKNKYGKDGYARCYIPNPDFDQFLKDIQKYLNDRDLFSKKLKEVDSLLRQEFPVRVGFPGKN
ncbi:MAG: HD domain-containing protein [Bacilli bacterium]|nr:HD domain-containing protein [Bacilli bacterium]